MGWMKEAYRLTRKDGAPGSYAGTYGPPRRQAVIARWMTSLRQRIRPMGHTLAKMEIRAFWSS